MIEDGFSYSVMYHEHCVWFVEFCVYNEEEEEALVLCACKSMRVCLMPLRPRKRRANGTVRLGTGSKRNFYLRTKT